MLSAVGYASIAAAADISVVCDPVFSVPKLPYVHLAEKAPLRSQRSRSTVLLRHKPTDRRLQTASQPSAQIGHRQRMRVDGVRLCWRFSRDGFDPDATLERAMDGASFCDFEQS